MSVRTEAITLVSWLLEQLTVKVIWREVEHEVPAVPLDPPDMWTSFVGEGHGMQRILKRIEKQDRLEVYEALNKMVATQVLVPANGRWALKIPLGYAIFGEGSQGVSCTTKRDRISADQQVVENPVMDDFQRRRWESARKSL